MKSFLMRWAITTLGVVVATEIIPGINADSWKRLIIAALLLGIFNAILRPVMMLLTLPLVIVTMGLFILVINAALLGLVAKLLQGFTVTGFWAALLGSIVISIISLLGNALVGKEKKREAPSSGSPRNPPPSPPAGQGPIIDV